MRNGVVFRESSVPAGDAAAEPRWRILAAMAALASVYFCAGKLGLTWASIYASASALWPASGIGLAALLVWGYRLWPGIFLGAFFVNITTSASVAASLAIASG